MGTVLSTFSSNETNQCGSTLVDRFPTLIHHPHEHLHHRYVHPAIHTNYTNTDRKSAFDIQTQNYDKSNHAYLYEDLDSFNDRAQSPSVDQCRDYSEDQSVSDTSKLTNSMNMLSLRRLIFPNLSRKPKSGAGCSRQSSKTGSSLMSRSEYRTQRIWSDGFDNFDTRGSEIPIYYYPNGNMNRVTVTKVPPDSQRSYSTRTSVRYVPTEVLPNASQTNSVRLSDYEHDKLTPSETQQLGFNQRHVRFNPKRQLSEPNGHFRPHMTNCGSGENLSNQQIRSRVFYTYTPSLIDLRRVNRCSDSQSLNPNRHSVNRNNSLRLPLSPYVSSRSSADVQIYPHGSSRLLTESDFHPEDFQSQGDSNKCTYDTSPAARSCTYNFDSRIYDGSLPIESEYQDQCHQTMDRPHKRTGSSPQSSYHLHLETYTDKQSLVQFSPVHLKHEQSEQVRSDLPAPVQVLKANNECSKSLTKSISCYALKFFNYHSTQPRLRKSNESEALFKVPKKRDSSFADRTRKSQLDKRRGSHILTRKDKHTMSTSTTVSIAPSTINFPATNPSEIVRPGSNNTSITLIGRDNTDNTNIISSNSLEQRINHPTSMYVNPQQYFDWNKSTEGKTLPFNPSLNYVHSKENGLYSRQTGTINPGLLEDNRSDIIDPKSISDEAYPNRINFNRSQWTSDLASTTQSGQLCSHHSEFFLRQPVYKASTSELLRCLSFYIVTRIQLRLTHGQHRLSTNLRHLQPSVIVAWIRAIDRALLLQGWSEVAFINPIHVVFLFMMLRDFVDGDITTEQELHTIIMACLYLAYSYMGNEISYPLKPFLVAETNQLIAHTDSDKKVLATEHVLIHGHENSIKSKVIDEVRNRFWQYVLKILNVKSSEMLRINADPVLFTELFGELKSYENAFTMPVKIPMRNTNRPL